MKKIILFALALVLTSNAEATLSVKEPCSDGMVLQQQSTPVIWGHASAGAAIKITTSWDKKSYSARTDAKGVWKVDVQTPAASYQNHSVKVVGDGESITINDVLIGEVWLASGQSNMEMPIRGFFNCPVEGANEVVSAAPMRDRIRMFTVEIVTSFTPVEDVQRTRGWEKADPSTVSEMSAVAYFFARKLNASLDVPVGIVSFPRGGSRVESWLPKETMERYGTESCKSEDIDIDSYLSPYTMYNGMEVPVQGYSAKGFIWYQGCSNVGADEVFVERMVEMVRQWRADWGDSENKMPFYTVEIAPFQYGGSQYEKAPLLRKAQHDAAKAIPNCEIVCTNDLVYPYEVDNIHPCQKEPVGNRLAYLALNRDYGFTKVACYSPEAVRAFRLDGTTNEIRLEMSNCPNGFNRWLGIEALEVCGPDGVFKPATYAYYDWGKFLIIKCDDVPNPCRVRYGWGDFKPGNLKNAEGLPVVPFDISLE